MPLAASVRVTPALSGLHTTCLAAAADPQPIMDNQMFCYQVRLPWSVHGCWRAGRMAVGGRAACCVGAVGLVARSDGQQPCSDNSPLLQQHPPLLAPCSCPQCEQTSKGTGCTTVGVCGKVGGRRAGRQVQGMRRALAHCN